MPVPEFITELRAMVGHHPLWLSGVSAVVVHDDGRVLLGRRSDTGAWAVPSGILEPGEQPAEAVVREVAEETGVTARVERLVAVRSETEPVRYPNGDVCQYLDLAFLCRWVAGEPRVGDDESTEVAWFSPDALPPLPPTQLERVRRALDPPREPWLP